MKRLIPAAIASATALLLAPSAGLASGSDDIRNAGKCDGGSTSKIKVKPDDGRIEVEFEVDQNVNGEKWKVKIKDNDEVVFSGSAKTKAPSGSFSIEQRIDDQPGSDKVVAVGRNKGDGERCTATATI